jgi:hypothetical protein
LDDEGSDVARGNLLVDRRRIVPHVDVVYEATQLLEVAAIPYTRTLYDVCVLHVAGKKPNTQHALC